MGEKMKQRSITIHLAVAYLDILMQDEAGFQKSKADTVALTCLLLASKFDELDENIPLIRELQRLCRQTSISYDEVVKCEVQTLNKLNWDLFKLTPLHFVQNLVGQGIVFTTDRVLANRNQLAEIDEKTLRSVKKHSEFFSDLSMQEYDFSLQYKPSVVAIASLICARRVSKIQPEWNADGFE